MRHKPCLYPQMIEIFLEDVGSFVVRLLCWRWRTEGEPLLGSWLNLLNWTGLGMSAEGLCYKDAFQHQGLANWWGMTGKWALHVTEKRKKKKKKEKRARFCQKAETGKELHLSAELLSWEHGESSAAGKRKIHVLDWTGPSPDLIKPWQISSPLIHKCLDTDSGFFISYIKSSTGSGSGPKGRIYKCNEYLCNEISDHFHMSRAKLPSKSSRFVENINNDDFFFSIKDKSFWNLWAENRK